MENVQEAFEMVLGKDFIEEMKSRLIIIGCSLAAVIAIIIIIAVWKSIALKKVKKAILALSEQPNNEQADAFFRSINRVSAVGKFFARHSKSFSGLPKGECRTIYNSTVLTSKSMSDENKKEIRDYLMKVGCSGLTTV